MYYECSDSDKEPILISHRDGPVIQLPDGELIWINTFERIQLYLGFTTLNRMVNKYKQRKKLNNEKLS